MLHAVRPGGISAQRANPQTLLRASSRRGCHRQPSLSLSDQRKNCANAFRGFPARAGFGKLPQDLVRLRVFREQGVHPKTEFKVRLALPGQLVLFFPFERQGQLRRHFLRKHTRQRTVRVRRSHQKQSAQKVLPEYGNPEGMQHAERRAQKRVIDIATQSPLGGFSKRKKIQRQR